MYRDAELLGIEIHLLQFKSIESQYRDLSSKQDLVIRNKPIIIQCFWGRKDFISVSNYS
jgi:hypothetical protein